jgi:hypothetical protein
MRQRSRWSVSDGWSVRAGQEFPPAAKRYPSIVSCEDDGRMGFERISTHPTRSQGGSLLASVAGAAWFPETPSKIPSLQGITRAENAMPSPERDVAGSRNGSSFRLLVGFSWEGGLKSEDNDHRTFCRRSHRRRTGRACTGWIQQNTELATSGLQKTSREHLRRRSAA